MDDLIIQQLRDDIFVRHEQTSARLDTLSSRVSDLSSRLSSVETILLRLQRESYLLVDAVNELAQKDTND